jgi:hypothetical protein
MQDKGTLPLNTPPRHRYITAKRFLLDAYQRIHRKEMEI